MADMTDEEKAAEKERQAAEAEKQRADAAAAKATPPKSPERAAAEGQAKTLRKIADAAAANAAMPQAERAAHEHNAARAELALNPRDEFRTHPPVYMVGGIKVGPNGRAIQDDGFEEPGPIVMWTPAPNR